MGADLDSSKLRYGKVFLLMDADADGHHIATLLLTFFFRHMRPLIDNGHVFFAQPPLYRIDAARDLLGRSTTSDRDRIIKRRSPPQRQAQHQPLQGPGRDDARHAEDDDARMGRDVGARFRMITENAHEIGDLDV
jgi:DNA gyrase/topoisomerase IV subunit B